MFRELPTRIAEQLAQMAQEMSARARWTQVVSPPSSPDERFHCLEIGNRRFLLAQIDPGIPLNDAVQALHRIDLEPLTGRSTAEIHVGLHSDEAWGNRGPMVVRLGVTASALQDVLGTITGLPEAWRSSQMGSLEQTLAALKHDNQYAVAALRGRREDGSDTDALEWLRSQVSWSAQGGTLAYLQSEGGKGKSTLMAYVARERLQSRSGPLPIYIPLRNVLRGTGVSWGEIMRVLGVVGPSAENLRHAVRAGLVVLLLDGLDEVAGRYDPAQVQEVAGLLSRECRTPRSIIVLTGRTTEGTLVGAAATERMGLDLPPVTSDDFRTYADGVMRRTCAELASFPADLPEVPWDGPLAETPLSAPQADALGEWIRICFEDYGRDRSLFFVQSLAAIGRSKQVAHNTRLVVHSTTRPPVVEHWEPCSLNEVCRLAAVLACERERSKVDSIAQAQFTTTGQLDLLSVLAVVGAWSATDRPAAAPNDLARATFGVDPVSQPEEFVAILRQMQKHALLFAAVDTAAVGEWRPAFLSEWIHAAFLVRAWENSAALGGTTGMGDLRRWIASAERGRPAFGSLFPSLLRGRTGDIQSLGAVVAASANAGLPAACANYWWLLSGLDEEGRRALGDGPRVLNDGTDLTELALEGASLGRSFSGNIVFLAGAEFQECSLCDVALDSSDLSGATFRGCTLTRVTLRYCSGPVRFENCTFETCTFEDGEGLDPHVWIFEDCRFDGTTRVSQAKQSRAGWDGSAIAQFARCQVANEFERPQDMLGGDYIGDIRVLPGLVFGEDVVDDDPASTCLRMVFETFFPRTAGTGREIQARPYIRSSAIGRGAMPSGSPSGVELLRMLEAEGFTDGGRANHLYAPWSSVAGATPDGIALRNEIGTFLRTRQAGPSVRRMIERVRGLGRW